MMHKKHSHWSMLGYVSETNSYFKTCQIKKIKQFTLPFPLELFYNISKKVDKIASLFSFQLMNKGFGKLEYYYLQSLLN